jgi:hypothetical protein
MNENKQNLKKKKNLPSMLAHTFNPSSWKADAG